MARILLIDDDDLFRESMKDMLEREGFDVTDAEDGKAGLKLFREGQFDLIITDIFMPNQDGITSIRELVKTHPSVKIIAISGGGSVLQSNDYLIHAKHFGASKTYQKPIDHKQLIDGIKELL